MLLICCGASVVMQVLVGSTKSKKVSVPSCMVHVLAQQLDWRLGPILFHLRHVEVIHQDHLLLAYGRPVDAFAPLLQLAINDVLHTR